MIWNNGWMNTWLTCPKGCGVSKGYTAPEISIDERCMFCGEELEGFRILKKENA